MEENMRSYYAIIPANVRYDASINANARLLYGEITALCNEQGYCWATNEYFAKLYNVSEKTITRWLKELVDKEYLYTELKTFRYSDGTVKKVRFIYIDNSTLNHIDNIVLDHTDKSVSNHMDKVVLDHMDKNVPYNNKYINNTKENTLSKDKVKRKVEFIPPSFAEVQMYIEEKGYDVDAKYFYDYFTDGNWIDSNGKEVKNWKQKIITWASRNNNANKKNNKQEVIYERAE